MNSCLHLIPVGLGHDDWQRWLPDGSRKQASGLRHFIVENAKSARAFLKLIGTEHAMQDIIMHALGRNTREEEIRQWLQAVPAGEDIGLVSEAGCPAVADPGARVVAQAHRLGMRVQPWVGPSAIMLGLMASGLQGQRFAFHGYAPVKAAMRDSQLRQWEMLSGKLDQTQILIETPYRNKALLDALLHVLQASSRLCIAASLTCDDEWIASKTIAQWRKAVLPDLSGRPTMFLFQAG